MSIEDIQNPSQDFLRFLESVAGIGREWQEAVDIETLLRLEKEERREAEKLLIERLQKDDFRAPPALAAAETRGAVMPMKRRLPEASGRMKVAMAVALAKLEAIPKADPIVASVLREGGDIDSGLPALVAAEHMRSPEIRDALAWSCVHHPVSEVRCNAGATLIYMAGLSTNPLSWDYRPLYLQLGADDEADRRRAFEELCAIVGMSPEVAD
ncbi:hypothetical protein [Chondromyces apiculatus]|uniref:HEAT repeat domain-containing protein n=1 Tax=Chondromyces apiculatus DSM 436 TaxID=1192034 RepID=A0A017T6G2_9BACT|nr:hypothetical protein [Chondromyces apiculatus]EYF04385.1 Hypothetical protein CAP_4524 [Chondromyces apiculatus DSM 436]